MNENLQFRKNNPGAVQYGNFINYYQFNLPEHRLEIFPSEILSKFQNKDSTRIVCLDIGCNAGVNLKGNSILHCKYFSSILGFNDKATRNVANNIG